jgi:hypothetical protein
VIARNCTIDVHISDIANAEGSTNKPQVCSYTDPHKSTHPHTNARQLTHITSSTLFPVHIHSFTYEDMYRLSHIQTYILNPFDCPGSLFLAHSTSNQTKKREGGRNYFVPVRSSCHSGGRGAPMAIFTMSISSGSVYMSA